MRELDAPYDRLATLPRELWLPGLVNSVGDCAQRLADLRGWLAALEQGELPPPEADFDDADCLAPLREAVG